MANTSTLDLVLIELQSLLITVKGVRQAPVYATEKNLTFPFTVVIPGNANIKMAPIGMLTNLWEIIIQLHLSRSKFLSRDMEETAIYADRIPNALYNEHLNQAKDRKFKALQTWESISVTQFGALGWGGIATFGISFVLSEAKFQRKTDGTSVK